MIFSYLVDDIPYDAGSSSSSSNILEMGSNLTQIEYTNENTKEYLRRIMMEEVIW